MARKGLRNISRLIDMAKEELPVEEAFLDQLIRCIEMEDASNKRIPSQTYKPSSMKCIRNMYYQRIGQEPDNIPADYNLIGICNSGTDTHLRIQTAISLMKKHGFNCEYVDVGKYVKSRNLEDIEVVSQSGMETKLFNKKYCISFLCDGVITYNKHYYIVEIKTESSFKWNNRTAPADEHLNQITSYSLSLGIPQVIFIYINRDNLAMKTYLYEPTDEMKNNLIGLIENCESYVSKNKVPPKPSDVDRKICQYCSYKSSCRKER